jgi:hypothetical protein
MASFGDYDENSASDSVLEKGKGDGLARGLQNITNQMSSVNLKPSDSFGRGAKRTGSTISKADSAASWLTGKAHASQSCAAGDPGLDTQEAQDVMAKYALAQPPSGALKLASLLVSGDLCFCR